jgi:TolA-binding protein
MEQIDDELREIKREIVESRSLVIKTNNLTQALAADLKSITKRQQSFERRAFYNSVFAYALFVAVIIGAIKVAWDARVATVTRREEEAVTKLDRLGKELESLEKQNAARSAAEGEAAALYELVRARRKKELVEAGAAISKLPLSRAERAFLQDAVDRARSELSVDAYQDGLSHAKSGRWVEAAQSFERSVQLADSGAHTPSAKLELGRALRKLGRASEAVPILSQLSEASTNPEVLDDATLLLAECLIDVQAYNDARTTLRAFLRRFPDSPLLNDARTALSDLNLKR